MQTRCFKAIVRGRVQGVFFRESARREAGALGITGYAHNLADGSVEVVACGETTALEAFERWLQHGPEFARVDDVSTNPFSGRDFSDFTTG
jgi:acylphosphatase